MKTKILLTSLLTLSVLTPVVAMGAVNYEAKKSSMTTAQSIAYAKQRLAESSAPAKVQQVALQQKKMSCEQNAKNKVLQGAAKSKYIAKCVYQNDAREAAEAMAGSRNVNSASLQRKYSSNVTAARID